MAIKTPQITNKLIKSTSHSVREDVDGELGESEGEQAEDDDDNDFLFFGTFDDEHSFKSIPIEETSPVRTTKRQRATSSLCVVDDHWEIFPETNDTKRNLSTNHLID
ncbi:unnamed protein product, partial [Didymodactylos carnosus]